MIATYTTCVKLSQGVEWSLHCAALVGLAPVGVSVPRRVLAEHFGLPDAYLAKHLQALVRAGVLQATTGPNGGFRLARDASTITALDIVDAIEGGSSPFLCQEIRQRGTGAVSPAECWKPCGISRMMDRANQAWRSALREIAVTDLIAMTPARIRERNRTMLSAGR